MTKFQF